MNNKNVCIIGAMDCEVEQIKQKLNNVEEIKQGELCFYKGTINEKSIVVVKSGVGKVCAAVCTQILADKFNPEYIINTGISGGIDSKMDVGDVVLATKLVQHDFDATAIGYAKGYICNNINPNEPTFFYPDKNLINNLEKILKDDFPQIKYHKGIIASGDIFIGSNSKKKEIQKEFGAIAVEMESAAIAHCAELNKIPFVIIRTISDLADDNAGESHEFTEETTAQLSSMIVLSLIEKCN